MTIADTLSEAVEDIKEYLEMSPEYYEGYEVPIKIVLDAMETLREKLDAR